MGLQTTCEGCDSVVLGVLTSLKKVNGRYLCSACLNNLKNDPKYYCNSCHNYSANALRKGNTLIEVVLYLFYIVPGIVYSIWRRNSPPNVCPLCTSANLIDASLAKEISTSSQISNRDEIECPYCAEKILAKAKLCKHCGKSI